MPLIQLSTIVEAYAVNIVDTAHKVSNGNLNWEEGSQNLAEAKEVISTEWEAYLGTILVEEEARLVEELNPLIERADVAEDRLQTIFQQRDRAALEGFIIIEVYQTIDPVSEAFDRLMTVQLDVAEREYLQGLEQYASMRVIFIIIMAAVLLAGFLFAWYIISGIRQRLGAEPERVAEITGQVGGAAFFLDNLSAVIVSVRDSSNSIHVGTREIASGNADLSSRTEEKANRLENAVAVFTLSSRHGPNQLPASVRNILHSASTNTPGSQVQSSEAAMVNQPRRNKVDSEEWERF